MFTEYAPSACYTGGRPDTLSVISATIRSDFQIEMRGQLLTRLSESWSSITGNAAHQILVYLNEIDPTFVMKVG